MNFRDDQSQPLFVECISVYVCQHMHNVISCAVSVIYTFV